MNSPIYENHKQKVMSFLESAELSYDEINCVEELLNLAFLEWKLQGLQESQEAFIKCLTIKTVSYD